MNIRTMKVLYNSLDRNILNKGSIHFSAKDIWSNLEYLYVTNQSNEANDKQEKTNIETY